MLSRILNHIINNLLSTMLLIQWSTKSDVIVDVITFPHPPSPAATQQTGTSGDLTTGDQGKEDSSAVPSVVLRCVTLLTAVLCMYCTLRESADIPRRCCQLAQADQSIRHRSPQCPHRACCKALDSRRRTHASDQQHCTHLHTNHSALHTQYTRSKCPQVTIAQNSVDNFSLHFSFTV